MNSYNSTMPTEVRQLAPQAFPALLTEIPDPPTQLFIRGVLPDPDLKYLCVVGSRKLSSYGRAVVHELIEGLAGYPIAIISGLALGTDAAAHQAALAADLPTVAVPGSGLAEQVLYPRTNLRLAREILEHGGALLSEFEPNFRATAYSFPQRNRIMAGMSHATLIIEATERSGTLITARLAMEYNRDVLAVPGSILSAQSRGPHMLIKNGATPIESAADILDALHIKTPSIEQGSIPLSPEERRIAEILTEPCSRDEIIAQLALPVHEASALLSALEIKGCVREEMGMLHWCASPV